MDGFETKNTKEDEPVEQEESNVHSNDLEKRVEALEAKTDNHEDRIVELEKIMKDFDSKLKDLENQMLMAGGNTGGEGMDPDALNKLI